MAQQIYIKGLDELIGKWKAGEKILHGAIKAAMQRAVAYVHSEVPPYPPEPPASTYIRTEQLGRSIHDEVKSIGNDEVGTIGTNLEYAPKVIDVDQQWPLHKQHGWWTLQGVLDKASGRVKEFFVEGFRNFLSKM